MGGAGLCPFLQTMNATPVVDIDSDALTALIVLRPSRASRNRHFSLFNTTHAREARRRAAVLRSLVRDIAGKHGPARVVGFVVLPSGEAELRYEMPRVSATRTARLSEIDLSIARVALAARGVRLVPEAVAAREQDHARVEALLSRSSWLVPNPSP